MKIDYRIMTIKDFTQITELWNQSNTMGYSESDTYERLREYFDRNPGMSFVACEGDRIVGTILCGHDGRRAFINHLYVAPDYRKKSIGNRLITMATEVFEKENPTKSYIFVKSDNEYAMTYWKKLGYYEMDEISVLRRSLSKEPFQVYTELDTTNIKDYMIRKGYFKAEDQIDAVEFGDGYMNMVFKVTGSTRSYIVKQSMPHGKINLKVYEPVERAKYEAMALEILKKYVPEDVPKHYAFDEIMNANIYEDCSRMLTFRKAIAQGSFYPNVGKLAGEYLAKVFFHTSTYGMNPQEKKRLSNQFTNYRLREITEDFMFTDPFFDSENNRIEPIIRPVVERLWQNKTLVGNAAILRNSFISHTDCLISGDFHPGNVFVSGVGVKFFDFEFSFFGPISYDLGAMIGNLMINIMTQRYYHKEDKEKYIEYLLETIKDIYHSFTERVHAIFEQNGYGAEVVNTILLDIEPEMVGNIGINMIGRTIGYCRFSEILEIKEEAEKKYILEGILSLVEKLICERPGFDELMKILESYHSF